MSTGSRMTLLVRHLFHCLIAFGLTTNSFGDFQVADISDRMALTTDMLAKLPPLCVKLFEAKSRTNLSFVDIGRQMQRSDVWVAAVFFGQAKPSFEDIKRMRNIFSAQGEMSLHDITERQVDKYFPERGLLANFLPEDPTVTRLNEVLKVYGHPIKAIINEKFGDGIISAVDCKVEVDKVPDANGDRVKVTIEGKFLAYKPW